MSSDTRSLRAALMSPSLTLHLTLDFSLSSGLVILLFEVLALGESLDNESPERRSIASASLIFWLMIVVLDGLGSESGFLDLFILSGKGKRGGSTKMRGLALRGQLRFCQITAWPVLVLQA